MARRLQRPPSCAGECKKPVPNTLPHIFVALQYINHDAHTVNTWAICPDCAQKLAASLGDPYASGMADREHIREAVPLAQLAVVEAST